MTTPDNNNDTKRMVIDDSLFNDFDALNAGWLVGALTNVGVVRDNNEDSIYAFFSKLDDTNSLPGFGIFIVADGAGGHLNGEVASALTMRTVARHLLRELYMPMLNNDLEPIDDLEALNIGDVLKIAIQEADTKVREVVPDGGCTCTVGVIRGNTLNIGHIGDSRLYVINKDGADRITRDHSVVGRLLEIGEIEPDDVKTHPQRSVLYRGIGMGSDSEVEVDILRKRLKTGDHVLLCSDGLWDMLSDEQIHKIVMDAKTPQDACHALVNQANLKGGEDNISVVIVVGPED
ncbi:MAG: PP2C family protein-serine/threonine phosphatase [Anaerolineae bacterium]